MYLSMKQFELADTQHDCYGTLCLLEAASKERALYMIKTLHYILSSLVNKIIKLEEKGSYTYSPVLQKDVSLDF